MSSTPEYRLWARMKNVCLNPQTRDYPDYGGRGITVYSEWRKSFETFFKYIGLRPSPEYSLDRKNNDGNYEPENVRWATKSIQQRNQRKRKVIQHFSDTELLAEIQRRGLNA